MNAMHVTYRLRYENCCFVVIFSMEINTFHFMGFVLIIKGIPMGLGAGSPVIMQGTVNPLI